MIFVSRKEKLNKNNIAPKKIVNSVLIHKYMFQYEYETKRGNKHKKIRYVYGMDDNDAKDALINTIKVENELKKYRSISNVKILGMLKVKNSSKIITV